MVPSRQFLLVPAEPRVRSDRGAHQRPAGAVRQARGRARRSEARNWGPFTLLRPFWRPSAAWLGRIRSRTAHARPRAPHKDPSMSNILVINASGQETRVALIEQGTISEYYLERKNEKGIVGNVYKGRVVRVLPGMQAAFVDIGLDKAAFLYVADIVADPSFPGFSEEIEIQAGATEGDPLDIEDLAEPAENGTATPPTGSAPVEAASATPTPESVAPTTPVDVSSPPAPAEATPPLEAPAVESPENPTPAAGEPNILPGSAPANGDAAAPASASAGGAGEPQPGTGEQHAEGHESEPILDLTPEEALDEGEDEGDDEDEDEDEGDAAHAAAEAAIAAEDSAEGAGTAATSPNETG